MNRNKKATYQNLWGITKAVLWEKFIAVSSYIKKKETKEKKSKVNKASGRKEVIKIKEEINAIENRKTMQKTSKIKSCFFDKMNKTNKF